MIDASAVPEDPLDTPPLLPQDTVPATPFDDLAPGLAALGFQQAAWRGEMMSRPRPGPGLRLVTRGTACLTHTESGLCTAMISEGFAIGSSTGVWLTDGAYTDVPFDQLCDAYGSAAALAVWIRAADLARSAVETELTCFVHHTAPRRFARWFLPLAGTGEAIHLTQVELARLGGLQRTSACAAMAILQAAGALKVMRGRFVIQDPDALALAACDCCTRFASPDGRGGPGQMKGSAELIAGPGFVAP
ncbi:Crp/Fnr family transcriptional regulator [Brevundimonas goettingensis]|uniref:Winged helix-turn-helix domain-containing protein n=1 Tax=Brevundimonas goettingensis TaxID=2774190 RepID=A0A975GV72_9CAUL|nr:helix-turn-helix domain-containing protein [Brevundimonas goettingensis]QTC90278.1 winged helix-turn-helix domain-containing protein [Brevundimonas goettingensis]